MLCFPKQSKVVLQYSTIQHSTSSMFYFPGTCPGPIISGQRYSLLAFEGEGSMTG